MSTLNEIAYNIKNLAYGGNSPKEVNITTQQIKHWIHYHRAKLIADNIDKGILSNHVLWQELKLDVHNYNNVSIRFMDILWDIYWQDNNLSPPSVTMMKWGSTPHDFEFINKLPKDDKGDFNGYWIPGPNIMSSNLNSQDRILGRENRNQYGLTTPSAQIRGDFRNISSAEFTIPEVLMLKNHGSIKDISLRRMVYHSDNTNFGEWEDGSLIENGPQHDFIHVPMKTIDEASYSDFNRFSSSNKPHAILKRTNKEQRVFFNPIKLGDYMNKEGEYYDKLVNTEINSGTLVLGLGGLQVSPSYFLDDISSGESKVRWAYDGNLRAIFSDPTKIISNRKYDFTNGVDFTDFESGNIPNDEFKIRDFTRWDDDKSPYPIPAEYIKDLIDRVIASEISVSIKAMSDELRDNVDTTKVMQYGAQVQG